MNRNTAPFALCPSPASQYLLSLLETLSFYCYYQLYWGSASTMTERGWMYQFTCVGRPVGGTCTVRLTGYCITSLARHMHPNTCHRTRNKSERDVTSMNTASACPQRRIITLHRRHTPCSKIEYTLLNRESSTMLSSRKDVSRSTAMSPTFPSSVNI